MSEPIYTIEKNSRERFQFSTDEFQGKDYFSVRIYYDAGNGEFKPTQKGVTFPVAKLSEFVAGVDALKEHLQ